VPPLSCSSSLSLPKITAVFRSADGKEIRSPFFVVNSKKSLSREQKAVLIDARRDLSKELFLCFLNDIKEIWRRKSP
jgi:hypothetical protein